MNESKVCAVVPIHNGKEYTMKFLETLKKVDYTNLFIIIVDDGSTDNSQEEIALKYPEIQFIKGDGTLWWTKSMNLGIEEAIKQGAEYILVLNNDVEVDKDIVKELINCASQYPDSIIGSKVYYKNQPNKIWHGGGEGMNVFRTPHLNMTPHGFEESSKYASNREIDYSTGMGTFIPVRILNKIGLYNENYLPHYYADVELTMRAKKKGYKIIFCPHSKLWNYTESTFSILSNLNTVHDVWNLLFFVRSNYLLKANLFLYYNYWPFYSWFFAFITLYTKLFFIAAILLLPNGKKLLNKLKKS